MKAYAALRRSEREMVLHAVALEHLRAAVIAMDRNRHCERALRNLEPIAIVGGDLEIVGHQIELLAGHAKRGVVVNVHGQSVVKFVKGLKG